MNIKNVLYTINNSSNSSLDLPLKLYKDWIYDNKNRKIIYVRGWGKTTTIDNEGNSREISLARFLVEGLNNKPIKPKKLNKIY